MAATVTLSTTTLTNGIDPRARDLKLDSTSGVLPGLFLFLGRELMKVESVLPSGLVRVFRGQNGTAALQHSSSEVVTIGSGHQFYTQDPIGSPAEATQVAPWINTSNGKIWYAQGDSQPTGLTFRWWQDVSTTYSIGALGIRTTEAAPTSST